MVQLVPMSEMEFPEFLEQSIVRYAEENVRAGYWNAAESLEKARNDHIKILPQGVATQNHFLFNIVCTESSEKVGTLFLAAKPADSTDSTGFIYDLFIAEPHRRKGHAMQAMRAIEQKAKELGIGKLSLHVFAHNTAAQALYKKLGYATSSLNMGKKL